MARDFSCPAILHPLYGQDTSGFYDAGMNRMITTFFRRGFMVVLMTTLTLSLFAEDKVPSEVIGPDGKPVEKATFYRVRMQNPNNGQPWGVVQMDLVDWKSGKRFDAKDNHDFFTYLVIDSPACALART